MNKIIDWLNHILAILFITQTLILILYEKKADFFIKRDK